MECEVPRSSRLIAKGGPDKGKNLLIWRWNAGNVTKEDIGDPTITTKFSLCVYDSFEKSRFRILSLAVDGGPGWRHGTADVWKYSSSRDRQEGVTGIFLKTGAAGRGKIRFKAEGSRLPMPNAASSSKLFHRATDVVVQLINSSTSQCWTSTFATADTNTKESFTAREVSRDSTIASRQADDEPCIPENSSETLTR